MHLCLAQSRTLARSRWCWIWTRRLCTPAFAQLTLLVSCILVAQVLTYALAPAAEQDAGKITLVLDLDETLVHSSFRPVPNPDFIIPVEIEGKIVDVYVLKRPHMDHFMAYVGQRFEVVVFTASLSKYAGALGLLKCRSSSTADLGVNKSAPLSVQSRPDPCSQ